MKILVTGGAGFIGGHVCEELLLRGHDVIIIDNLSSGKISNIPSGCTFYRESILDIGSIDAIMREEKVDQIIHLSAQVKVTDSIKYPLLDCNTNIVGTINILELMNRHSVKKITFSSSAAVYGDQSTLPVEEHFSKNVSSQYAVSKLAGEKYIEMYSKMYEFDYCIFRFSNVFGSRQDKHDGGVISLYLDHLKNNSPFVLYGDGTQTRDFIYVKTIASVIVQSLHEVIGTYNLSTEKEITLNKTILTMQNIHKKHKGKIKKIKKLEDRPGDIKKSVLSNKKLRLAGIHVEDHHLLEQQLLETYLEEIK